MEKSEFRIALKQKKVESFGGEYRIKGFKLIFSDSYAKVRGKIPLPLVAKIYKKDMSELITENDDGQNCFMKECRVSEFDDLLHMIDSIREMPYTNEWAIGNE